MHETNEGGRRVRFEFPDDCEVASDFEVTPSLKISRDIFIPSIHWLRQKVFLEGSTFGQPETAPTRGVEPLNVEENDEIMNYLIVEGSLSGHLERA